LLAANILGCIYRSALCQNTFFHNPDSPLASSLPAGTALGPVCLCCCCELPLNRLLIVLCNTTPIYLYFLLTGASRPVGWFRLTSVDYTRTPGSSGLFVSSRKRLARLSIVLACGPELSAFQFVGVSCKITALSPVSNRHSSALGYSLTRFFAVIYFCGPLSPCGR